MRGQVEDKILVPLLGRPVIDHSIGSFKQSGFIDFWAVVYRDEEQLLRLRERMENAKIDPHQIVWVTGGKERQNSVLNALEALPEDIDYVFIHDSARPILNASMLRKLQRAVSQDGAAVLAHRAVDTMKQLHPNTDCPRKARMSNLDRHLIWAMETPQVFTRSTILEAYRDVRAKAQSVTDDTAVLIDRGIPITLIENTWPNPKITFPQDLAIAEVLLRQLQKEATPPTH